MKLILYIAGKLGVISADDDLVSTKNSQLREFQSTRYYIAFPCHKDY